MADRVHERVIKIFKVYIGIVVGVIALAGVALTWGVKAKFDAVKIELDQAVRTAKSNIENTKNEVQKQGEQTQQELTAQMSKLRELTREIRIHAADLQETIMAQRADVQDFVERERGARLGAICLSWPTVANVTTWLTQQETPSDERGIDIVVAAVRRYNICDLQELSAVLASRSQDEIRDLYRRILGRAPDIAGKITWGWRLDHGFLRQTVERMIQESDEARQRGR